MKLPPLVKKLWSDPVWSKVIATSVIAIAVLIVSWLSQLVTPPPNLPTEAKINSSSPVIAQPAPRLTLNALQNLTYRVDQDDITLQDGKREFNPDTSADTPIPEKAIFAYLTDHAFGDLSGNGSVDAIAVLQVSDGGSGIYYYLAPVLNDRGSPKAIGRAFVLGDRLVFRSIAIRDGKVTVELMMHNSTDGLCCPTVFRTLEFVLKGKTLQCTTEPCSEV